METKFIVLRDTTPKPERVMRSERGLGVDPQAIEAKLEQRNPREERDLDEDQTALSWAPAMPTALVRPLSAPSSPAATATRESVAWGVRAVQAPESELTGAGVSVAVLDTGIFAAHPSFAGIQKLEQMDFTGEGDGDGNGHGTHCAGTIFGRAVHGTRIGVAPGIQSVFIGKVLTRNGGGSSNGLVDGLLWAAKHQAHVIAMSLGIDYPGYVQQLIETQDLPPALATSQALDAYRSTVLLFKFVAETIQSRVPKGVVIAAAGNESRRSLRADFRIGVSLPAVTQGIISVGALGQTADGLAVADFSNADPVVSAPGVDIESAGLDGGLTTMSGTSMAAPHVAGVAALWAHKLRLNEFLDPKELRARVVTLVTQTGFRPGYQRRDIGGGLVLAPKSIQ